MGVDFIGYAYAAVVAAGGIMGFVKKGSVMSGLMGVAAGSLAGLGAYQTSQNPNNLTVALGVSGALTGLMGYRQVVQHARQNRFIHYICCGWKPQ